MPDREQGDGVGARRMVRFDSTIQLGHLLQLIGMVATVAVAAMSLWNFIQTKIFEQDKQYAILNQLLAQQAAEIKSVRDSVTQVRADQKELQNAVQITLTSINEKLTDLRISIANRDRDTKH